MLKVIKIYETHKPFVNLMAKCLNFLDCTNVKTLTHRGSTNLRSCEQRRGWSWQGRGFEPWWPEETDGHLWMSYQSKI